MAPLPAAEIRRRFLGFFAARGHTVGIDFDIELAKKQSNENPVYYVQYAHARICSILRQAEEAGLAAGTLRRLAGFYSTPGFSNEFLHLFLATDLRPAQGTPDDDEDIALRWMPLAEALAMIDSGEIKDAKTMIGLLMAARV